MWVRQLLRRIEAPMQRFARNRALMGGRESKKVIRLYNRVAKALVEFEALWHAAWLKVGALPWFAGSVQLWHGWLDWVVNY
jgi:dynein heavy chain